LKIENSKLKINPASSPLTDRLRPQFFGDFFGQKEVAGKDSFLRRSVESGEVPSLIFWGPPGTGKTTLAEIIARQTQASFQRLSGVMSGKAHLKKVLEEAQEKRAAGERTILFIDEIHRWTKTQQDALLPAVEDGTVTLIGATTENPSFEVVSALLSRARVLVLNSLTPEELLQILKRGKASLTKQVQKEIRENEPLVMPEVSQEVLQLIAHLANGDARMALNTLEASFKMAQAEKSAKGKRRDQLRVTPELVKKVLQKSHLLYDKGGEEHYNIISALHKSMRGGDAHAAVYWLTRMIEGGEDPLYIARRLLRFASEDVGLADNHAVILANTTFETCQKLGLPECNTALTQCVIYLTKTKKNIVAYQASKGAAQDVRKWGNLPVPLHLRNALTSLMKDLNYGKNYKYSPLEDDSDQEYLPPELKGRKYF